MAENPIKKSDIADFEGIQKAVNDLIASLEKLSQVTHKELKESADAVAKSLQGISASSAEGQAAISNAAKATEGLMAEQKQLVAVDKQLTDARAKLNTLQNEGVQQKIKETAETKKSIAEKQKEITQGKAAADSYVVLVAKLKQLRDAWKLTGEAGRKDLTPQIQKIDKQLKDLDKSIGQHQRNVGNYGSALAGMGKQLLSAAGLMGGAALAVKGFKAVMESTQAISDKFAIFLGGVNEAGMQLARSIANMDFTNLIEGMRSAFLEGKRYAETLDLIGDLQRSLGIQLIDVDIEIARQRAAARDRRLDIKEREAAIEEIIRLEQSKVDKTQKLAEITLDNEIKNIQSRVSINKETIVDFISNHEEYLSKLEEGKKLQDELTKQATDVKQRTMVDEVTKQQTIVVTTKFNEKRHRELVAQLSDEEKFLLSLVKMDIDLVDAQRERVESAIQGSKKAVLEQATAEESLVMLKVRLYNELIKEEKELTTETNKEVDERTKAAIAAREAFSKEQSKIITEQKQVDDEITVGAQELSNKLIEIKKQEVQQINDLESTKEQFTKETNRAILRDKIAAMEDEFQILSDASQVLGDIFAAQKQRELNAAGDNAQKREEIERDYFKKEQSLAIAQAVINGALAVTKVTAQTGILSPFAIPLIVATTLGQIALISSQKFAEGGYTGDGSYRDETGQKVAGIVHEKEFVLDRDSTKKYRPLIEAIHEDDPAKIAAIVSNEHMHNIWGNMNKAIGSSQDPYTRLMYDLMKSQPSIYVDSDGNTVLQYIGRKQVIRKN